MNAKATERPAKETLLAAFLAGYSVEVTTRDKDSLAVVSDLPKGTEVFIASHHKDAVDRLVAVAGSLRDAGLEPVPHIVARNLTTRAALGDQLKRLTDEAGVRVTLILGGDRDQPAGEFQSALELIETELFLKNGIKRAYISAYPEGHPRISDVALDSARAAKLKALKAQGIEANFVSQFAFESGPVVAMARHIRAQGQTSPLRVGVAGPSDYAKLVKYALICGVGPSLRALKERQGLARNMLAGETPEHVLTEVAAAQCANPSLEIAGPHFFTFGALDATRRWVQQHAC